MTRFLVFLTLLMPAFAFAQTDRDNTVRRRDPEPPAKFWLQRYPIRRYAAYWHLDIGVADFDRAYEHVRTFIDKFDGTPAQPIERSPQDTVKYQQFSVAFDRKKARRVVRRLEKIGRVRRKNSREELHPELEREAAVKLEQLRAETEAGRESLRALPSIRAAIEELKAHLSEALEAYESSKDRVLLNIVIEQEKR